MILEISPTVLLDELSAVVSAADKPGSPGRPLLDLVHIEPTGKHLKFQASDGIVTLESYLPLAECKKSDITRSFCLPAKKILDLIKLMSCETVMITVDNNGHAYVKGGKSRYRILSVEGHLYPRVFDTFEQVFTFPNGGILKKLIKLTRGFIGEDDSRFAFSGGLLEVTDETIRMVGTDGARMSVATYTSGNLTNDPIRLLIPHKALTTLAGMAETYRPVQVATARNMMGDVLKVKFKSGRRILTANLTAGQFPNWEKALPPEAEVQVSVERASLLSSLQRSLVASDHRSRFVEMRFEDGRVFLKTDGSDAGEDIVACDYVRGNSMPDVRIGLNADFITQFLSVVPEVLDGPTVLMSYSNENSFIEFRPESSDCEFRYLVAPGRV